MKSYMKSIKNSSKNSFKNQFFDYLKLPLNEYLSYHMKGDVNPKK